MKKYIIIFICLISSFSYAQEETCGAHEKLQADLERTPALRAKLESYMEYILQWVRNNPIEPTLHRSPVTIPIVVHVIYKNSTENVSDALIKAQIAALNKDYAKQNTDLSTVPAVFRNLSANTYIQFALAKRAPDNTATTGITRKSTTKSFFSMSLEDIKAAPDGQAAWDTKKYLNVWVGDIRFYPTSSGDDLNGYGTFPADTAAIQGIVMDFTQFGTLTSSSYSADRTWCHEIGHFFDLRHIWGDGGCGATDHVSDTPDAAAANRNCPTFPHVSCSNGPNGDMFMNIMDYTDDACRRMFTAGQRNRMLASLAPGGRRASLATSNALIPPNASTINHQVYLEPQNSSFPSWKAALVMIHGWACQCTPDVDQMVQQNSGQSNRHITGIPNEVSEVIHALALTPEQLLMSFSSRGFYNLLQGGPIALLTVSSSEYYGLVINGMSIDPSGNARLSIKDPMSIGPRIFSAADARGSEYTVDYSQFMTNVLDRLARENKKVFIVYPPSATARIR